MVAKENLEEVIRERLQNALAPVVLEIDDESGRHKGHAGADGGSHYRVRIVSAAFEGQSLVERQRVVYQALAGVMGSAIHALAMTTETPDEASSKVLEAAAAAARQETERKESR